MMSRIDDKPFEVQETVCCSARGDGSNDGTVVQNDMPGESGGHQLRGCFGELGDAFIVDQLSLDAVGRPLGSDQFVGTHGDVSRTQLADGHRLPVVVRHRPILCRWAGRL